MSKQEFLNCLIAFVLGWLLSHMMGDGFSVGGDGYCEIKDDHPYKVAKETENNKKKETRAANIASNHMIQALSSLRRSRDAEKGPEVSTPEKKQPKTELAAKSKNLKATVHDFPVEQKGVDLAKIQKEMKPNMRSGMQTQPYA